MKFVRSSGSLSGGLVRPEEAIIAILLGYICLQLWGLGVTHTDDAVWVLQAHQPFAHPPMEAAVSQGRLWLLPIGIMMQFALYWQGTLFGEILRLGSFAVFFLSFCAVVAAYWGRRTAAIAAILFVALNAVRWDGSALTTYPLLVWPSATLCAWSVLLGRHYYRTGTFRSAAFAGIFLLLSLFNNEGITALFVAVFALSILGNILEAGEFAGLRSVLHGRGRDLVFIEAAATLVYAGIAVTWLASHPSHYPGHALAPFDLHRFAWTLSSFSFGGSILHDFLIPYSVSFADRLTDTGIAVPYKLAIYALQLRSHPGHLLFGALVAAAMYFALRRSETKFGSRRDTIFLVLAGLVFASVPIMPVAMTEKYQTLHIQLGVQTYVMTVLSHFGVALMLAGIVLQLKPRGFAGTSTALVIAVVVGVLGATASRLNEAVITDIRPETGRWRVLNLALGALDSAHISTATLYSPKFRSGSWYTVVPDDYWTQLARYTRDRTIDVVVTPAEIAPRRDFAVLDYGLMENDQRFYLTLSHVTEDRSIDAIAVMSESVDPSSLSLYALSYRDADGKTIHHRLAELPRSAADRHVKVLTGIKAELNSVTLAPISQLSPTVLPK